MVDGFPVPELPCIDVRFRRCIKHRVCVSVSANSIFAACAANSVYGVGQWNDEYGRDLENIGWNRDQRWPIYGALIERDLHRNCDQFSGFHQVGFRNYHGLAAHSGIDFRFSRDSDYSNRRAATIHRFRFWHEQHRRGLESDRWNGHDDWPVHRSVHGRHLHRNCDQCSGFHQIGFCDHHGLAIHSGINIRFSGHGKSPGRGAATVHRDDFGDEQHRGNVDGIWWHNHDEWNVHSAYSGGYLHGHGRKRSKQFDVRFC